MMHSAMKKEAKNENGRVVLVGTYKGDQLTKWRGWYNYPISDKDKITEDDAAKITELWLFNGKKYQRTYKVQFVGIKTHKQLKAYLESPDRNDPDLAKRLPAILTKLRPEQLRVCKAAVQMNLFAWEMLQPVHVPKNGEFTAVELFAGADGLSIGLERAGIHVVIANEIMPDFAATLAANHPDTNVINDDRVWEAA